MNLLESRMLDTLKRGRDHFGVVAVKAEFEAEGTRPDELHRLTEIARRADVKIALKIGGCEAVTDLYSAKIFGIDYIIAPMIETAYALTKFIEAKHKTHGKGNQLPEFLFNIETRTTLDNLSEILPVAELGVDGVVFGRVDFTQSCGLSRNQINDRIITDAVLEVAAACRDTNLSMVVGGGVSVAAISALREIRSVKLDRFETRKVVFDGSAVEANSIEAGIANAVDFELDWLRNKREYYTQISREDDARIDMMEARLPALSADALAA